MLHRLRVAQDAGQGVVVLRRDVPGSLLLSPAYCAVSDRDPVGSVESVRLAEPFDSVALPIAATPSKNATVPLGL